MTPAARISAAITVLDQILAGSPAEQALLRWSRASRFAGSGDRAALRDLVFGALRQRDSLAALGGGSDGAGADDRHVRQSGPSLDAIFTGEGHAPSPQTEAEAAVVPPDPLPDDLPDWLRPAWRQALGDQADAVALAMTQRAPVWLRVNGSRATPEQAAAVLAADGITVEAAPQLASALRVVTGDRWSRGPAPIWTAWSSCRPVARRWPARGCRWRPACGSWTIARGAAARRRPWPRGSAAFRCPP